MKTYRQFITEQRELHEGDPLGFLVPAAAAVALAPEIGRAADWAAHRVTGAVAKGVQSVVRSAMRKAGDIWRMKDGKWGAKNHNNKIQYFIDQQKAHAFAQG
jgi:hypothetical protein